MPDNISRQRLKKKVLDRWENEGGKVLADQTGIIKSSLPEEHPDKDNVGKTFVRGQSDPEHKEKL
jgi:hypothetical protein